MALAIEARAARYATAVIARSTDWQEVQNALFDHALFDHALFDHALFDHAVFGPWLTALGSDGMAVVRAAEEAYGPNLPSGYSD